MKGDIGMALKFKSKSNQESFTGDVLQCYVLTLLACQKENQDREQDLYEAQILKNVQKSIDGRIKKATLNKMLNKLAEDGIIEKIYIPVGRHHDGCRITDKGRKWLKKYMQELSSRIK